MYIYFSPTFWMQIKKTTTFTTKQITEPIQFTEILMKGMDIVTIGGNLNAVIHTKQQYDSLIYARFQKPLDDYWNQNYESTLLL